MKHKKRNRRRGYIFDAFISTIMTFLVMLIFPLFFDIEAFEPFKKALSDFQITDDNYSQLREQSAIHADTNIAIIDIERLNMTGLRLLISHIDMFEPKVIALNRTLESSGNELEDLAFQMTLSEVSNFVLADWLKNPSPITLKSDSIVTSDTLFGMASTSGYLNILFGKDKRFSTVREFYPLAYYKDSLMKSFPVIVAEYYDSSSVQRLIERGNKSEIINYRGNFSKFYFLNGLSILENEEDLSFLTGKIVLLGVDGNFRGFDLLDDLFFTPMNENSSGRTFPDMSLITIQANIISMIINGNYIEKMPEIISWIFAFILCFINMYYFAYICRVSKKWFELVSLFLFVIESLIILALTVYIFDYYNYQIKLTEALFAIALSVFVFQFYNETIKYTLEKIFFKKMKVTK